MRCEVVNGRLPPKIRSQQEALFNDPESGYDVMVGSDAIGMGLNLYVSSLVLLTKTNENAGKSVVSYLNPSQNIPQGPSNPFQHPKSNKQALVVLLAVLT